MRIPRISLTLNQLSYKSPANSGHLCGVLGNLKVVTIILDTVRYRSSNYTQVLHPQAHNMIQVI